MLSSQSQCLNCEMSLKYKIQRELEKVVALVKIATNYRLLSRFAVKFQGLKAHSLVPPPLSPTFTFKVVWICSLSFTVFCGVSVSRLPKFMIFQQWPSNLALWFIFPVVSNVESREVHAMDFHYKASCQYFLSMGPLGMDLEIYSGKSTFIGKQNSVIMKTFSIFKLIRLSFTPVS